jgi:uncharacterized protein YbjT (DUF2867 family)
VVAALSHALSRGNWLAKAIESIFYPTSLDRLQTLGTCGQITYAYGSLTEPDTYQPYLSQTDVVINAAGARYPRFRGQFSTLHKDAPVELAKRIKESNVKHFIHISALGAGRHIRCEYLSTKEKGEFAIRDVYPQVTVIRPGLTFGRGDYFFSHYAKLIRLLPMIPIIGSKTHFQPVYAKDIGVMIAHLLNHHLHPELPVELAGPHCYSIAQLVRHLMKLMGIQRPIYHIHDPLVFITAFLCQFFPFTPIPFDQIHFLAHPHVLRDPNFMRTFVTAHHFSLTPTTLESLPIDQLLID